MWRVDNDRLSNKAGETIAVRGDVVEPGVIPTESLDWLEEQGKIVWVGAPDDEADLPDGLTATGNGWYELPDGTKKRGRANAEAALAELDVEV